MNPKTQILYVDDEPINLMLFSKLLTNDKFEILVANTGHEGLEILDKHPNVNTIFSDFRMPEMDGIEFIKKAKIKFPQKEYYLLTSDSLHEKIQKAIEEKLIDGYLHKPCNKRLLVNTITKFQSSN